MSIFMERFSLGIHIQSGGVERFGPLIIEKTCTMRLSKNLPYKLWREIVVATIYLYNWNSQASKN